MSETTTPTPIKVSSKFKPCGKCGTDLKKSERKHCHFCEGVFCNEHLGWFYCKCCGTELEDVCDGCASKRKLVVVKSQEDLDEKDDDYDFDLRPEVVLPKLRQTVAESNAEEGKSKITSE